MAVINKRHHAAHPPSSVKPNVAVNQKPNYTQVEKAEMPNVSPSSPGPVGVDLVNSRLGKLNLEDTEDEPEDDDSDEDEEDRTDIPIHN